MGDNKSKLPDIKEISSMATKLFKDVKTSITEIIVDYKKKREQEAAETKAKTTKSATTETKATKSKTKKTSE